MLEQDVGHLRATGAISGNMESKTEILRTGRGSVHTSVTIAHKHVMQVAVLQRPLSETDGRGCKTPSGLNTPAAEASRRVQHAVVLLGHTEQRTKHPLLSTTAVGS